MNRADKPLRAGRVFMISVVVVLATPRLAYPDEPPALEDVTLEKLKAVNQANRQALGTAVLQETVSESYRERPGGEREARERMIKAYLDIRDAAIEMAIEAGANEKAFERIEEDCDSNLNGVDDAMIVRALNKNVLLARTRVIDFALERARADDQDLRDVEGLLRKRRLNSEQRPNLSKTLSQILNADHSITLVPTGHLAVVRPRPCFSADLEAARLGIVPKWVLEGDLELKLRRVCHKGESYVEITGRREGGRTKTVLAELTPKLGYRLTRLVRYDEGGNVIDEFRASSYKPVDGVMVPFETELRRAAYGIGDYLVRRRTVKSVRLNQSVAAYSFDIPDGYHVQDVRLRH